MINIAFPVNPTTRRQAVSGGAGYAWFTGRETELAGITAPPDPATCGSGSLFTALWTPTSRSTRPRTMPLCSRR